jgi:hypothetical protein
METIFSPPTIPIQLPSYQEAWQMVLGELRMEMARAAFETWVQPLQPVSYHNHIFTVGAYNPYARDWVESRLRGRIAHLLGGLYNEPVQLQVAVLNTFFQSGQPTSSSSSPEIKPKALTHEVLPAPAEEPLSGGSARKVMLQRVYGSERARLIQPERGMFLTLYLFNEWLPLLGHSAFTVILAARSLCYWNPQTGELRNIIETEMRELARRAAVSVRTVKDVLASPLVRQYFLRYRVRRMMTPNGVRTAGILLQVRMDDPLIPHDQELSGIPENSTWLSPDLLGEDDDGENP